ncbi:copper resistance protein CopC [Paenibacillus alginolyticus]|uniref:Copper resistance protein CopC n=1 Tax=Paenibacillus alginolyticus TaxID=59839 RepID=A0ABT4GIY8_9BACL|nr:copper resistance protein CopC [Paenibacillus alginolyticus]MCY9696157.1 copper resistance protein CopC [Paenibacillus alginolyticus]MEC0143310.1 copper resistance protein CopC [Paenibacillus alginolyticus]
MSIVHGNKLWIKLVLISSILLLSFTMFLSKNAFAHTGLESSNPKAGAEVTEALKEITLTFEGKLENLSAFKLFDNNKQEIKLANFTLKEKTMTGLLSGPLSNGNYEVQWTIVGEDGHPIQGKYSFTVKRAEEQPQAAVTATPSPAVSVAPSIVPSPSIAPIKNEESKPNPEKAADNSTNYLIWVGIGAVVIIAIVALLSTRRKK